MLLIKHEKKLLPRPTEAMLEQVAAESEESVDMRKYLFEIKKNPILLASWEHPYSFDEACKRYDIVAK